ncbi:MAG: tetratricopeptide repeat protein [Armatimonadetes bacterium]|nr:tetratricopeptide repeat protein [Armatimonadota bacterium]
MNLLSRRWRLVSAVLLAAGALLLACGAGHAEAPGGRSVLLFPVRSHWLSEPLAESVTGALLTELSASGFRPIPADAEAPAVRLAISQGWVEEEDLEGERVSSTRHRLAVAVGAGTSLTAEVVEGSGQVVLKATLAGSVSRREASFEVSTPSQGDPKAVARELARQVAAVLAGPVWAEAGADEEGARSAAMVRYAAGREALALGMYRDAVLELDAALIAEPDRPEYLWVAAEARAAGGDSTGAMAQLRRLAELAPEDTDVLLRLGEVALRAGEPERAEAAFLKAEELSPDEPLAIEGVARSARARGDFARSESRYARLLPLVGVNDEAGRIETLPATLAHMPDDTIRFAGIPPDEVGLQFARVYLWMGDSPAALAALFSYDGGGVRRAYTDAEYEDVAPALDEHSEALARGAQRVFAERALEDLDDEEADAQMDRLHDESDRLATLGERIQVSPRLDPAHRYRVLAYNLLNESNFETLMFLRTGDEDHQRRAEVLRSAFREARAQANLLGDALVASEGEGAAGLRPGKASSE